MLGSSFDAKNYALIPLYIFFGLPPGLLEPVGRVRSWILGPTVLLVQIVLVRVKVAPRDRATFLPIVLGFDWLASSTSHFVSTRLSTGTRVSPRILKGTSHTPLPADLDPIQWRTDPPQSTHSQVRNLRIHHPPTLILKILPQTRRRLPRLPSTRSQRSVPQANTLRSPTRDPPPTFRPPTPPSQTTV